MNKSSKNPGKEQNKILIYLIISISILYGIYKVLFTGYKWGYERGLKEGINLGLDRNKIFVKGKEFRIN